MRTVFYKISTEGKIVEGKINEKDVKSNQQHAHPSICNVNIDLEKKLDELSNSSATIQDEEEKLTLASDGCITKNFIADALLTLLKRKNTNSYWKQ